MKYVIIGNGAAGAYAAKTITDLKENTSLTVIGDEAQAFYSRLRLPELISNEVNIDKITLFKAEWYKARNIDLRLGTMVKDIIHSESRVILDSGDSITYDKLLLCVGSKPFVPPIPGIMSNNIYSLRTIADAVAIKERTGIGTRAVIIGGGLLGLEVANSLCKLGTSVTVVEYFPRLLPRQIDEEGSLLLKEKLEALGIRFELGRTVQSIDNKGVSKTIKLDNGTLLETDSIIVSAGVKPKTELAQRAGLNVGNGIIVNDFLQTNYPNIYAAGDCIEHDGMVYGIWSAAKEQGEIAARNICGEKTAYKGTQISTTLKVAGIDLTSLGNIDNASGQAIEYKYKNTSEGKYIKIFVKCNRLAGAIIYGNSKGVRSAKKLIESREDISGKENEVLLSLV